MSNVDFITFCHPGDIHRLYNDTWLADMVASHGYKFSTIKVIHQRCEKIAMLLHDITRKSLKDYSVHIIPSEAHSNILTEFGLPEGDPIADRWTHGPTAPHYWKWHVINHLIGLKVSSADYIVFSDNDCTIRSQVEREKFGWGWIEEGIRLLEKYPNVLIVSPGDGAQMFEAKTEESYRLTQNVSQQLFLCNRERLKTIDFNISWNWEMLAPGGPMQEYYWMLEGRIWRYMNKYDQWRCILPDSVVRYWHHGLLNDQGFFEVDYSKY